MVAGAKVAIPCDWPSCRCVLREPLRVVIAEHLIHIPLLTFIGLPPKTYSLLWPHAECDHDHRRAIACISHDSSSVTKRCFASNFAARADSAASRTPAIRMENARGRRDADKWSIRTLQIGGCGRGGRCVCVAGDGGRPAWEVHNASSCFRLSSAGNRSEARRSS